MVGSGHAVPKPGLSEGSISPLPDVPWSWWDNGSSRPALSPFSVFSMFSGMHMHHFYTWTENEAAEFLSLSAPSVLAGWEGALPSPSFPSPSCGTFLHHCLLPLVLLPLQTGSCFLVQSSKQNPLSLLSSCPPPLSPGQPASFPPHCFLVLGRPGLGQVQWPLVLTSGWFLMPTLGLSSRTGWCAGYSRLLRSELPDTSFWLSI